MDVSLWERQNCLLSPVIQTELVGIPSTLREIKKSLISVQQQDFWKSQTLYRHQGNLSLENVQFLHSYIGWFTRDLHWQMVNFIKITCGIYFYFSFKLSSFPKERRGGFSLQIVCLYKILCSEFSMKHFFGQILKPMENQVAQQQQQQHGRSCPVNIPVLDGSVGHLFYRVDLTRSNVSAT